MKSSSKRAIVPDEASPLMVRAVAFLVVVLSAITILVASLGRGSIAPDARSGSDGRLDIEDARGAS